MTHTVIRPIIVSRDDGPAFSEQEILEAVTTQTAAVLVEDGHRLASPKIEAQVLRGMAARRWFERDRPDGKHEGCPNPAGCVHQYDQGLAEIDHGAILIVLEITVKD